VPAVTISWNGGPKTESWSINSEARVTLKDDPSVEACFVAWQQNTYEDPCCQETDYPSERIFQFFPQGFRLSIVRLWLG
jgi:hypothetical protein